MEISIGYLLVVAFLTYFGEKSKAMIFTLLSAFASLGFAFHHNEETFIFVIFIGFAIVQLVRTIGATRGGNDA